MKNVAMARLCRRGRAMRPSKNAASPVKLSTKWNLGEKAEKEEHWRRASRRLSEYLNKEIFRLLRERKPPF